MADKKKQHYIPKLYLKLFSINNENSQIALFFLPKELYKPSVPLKSQAKEDYFYGEDGTLEEDLSKLEALAAPCLKDIIKTTTLPKKLSEDYFKILSFSMIMASRTKDAAEEINAMTDQMAKLMMSGHDEFKDKLDDYVIRQKNAAAIAIATTAKSLSITFDLKLKLLINKTNLKFITSDNPVIKYNQFLEKRKHFGGHVGLATKGLQIFFPVSPTHMLCFYDEWVYKIGDKLKTIVDITDSEDIDKLNSLQILNCFDHLYFNSDISEPYIKQLYKKVNGKRILEYPQLKEVQKSKNENGEERVLYHSMRQNLNINLQLSFVTETKRAKRHVLNDYAAQLRNEGLRQRL